MNRLEFDAENISTSSVGLEQPYRVRGPWRERTTSEEHAPFSTFAPQNYEPNYAYPLFVWLHGAASNEHELRQVMPHLSMRNYVAVAPRATSAVGARRFDWMQAASAIELAESRLVDSVATAKKRFHINDQRVFVGGYGSGGTMALRLAWRNPGAFAGVVAINGGLPTQGRPMSRVNEIRRLPCLLATFRDSRTYPANQVCGDLKLLHSAGCTVALRQYPVADGITNSMLADVNSWMMELVCSNR